MLNIYKDLTALCIFTVEWRQGWWRHSISGSKNKNTSCQGKVHVICIFIKHTSHFLSVGDVVLWLQGGAAFWFNLRPSGATDPRTLHGGCPVLVGSKWGNIYSFLIAFCLSNPYDIHVCLYLSISISFVMIL